MTWHITKVGTKIPKLNNPIFMEGLPGIGNVGKVAVDFMIDELNAVKVYDLFSPTMPHSVFVTENNLVELPSIGIYIKKRTRKQDLVFLTGDVQPVDEESSYELTARLLDICTDLSVTEIITLGGIGLQTIPKKPKTQPIIIETLLPITSEK